MSCTLRLLTACVLTLSLSLATIGAAVAQETPAKAGSAKLETVEQKASYGIGYQIGDNLSHLSDGLDIALLIQGLRDALANSDPQLAEEELGKAMEEFETAAVKRAGEKNQRAGEEFLAANKKKPGVETTPSGLQYKVIKSGAGAGASPKVTDRVQVHYHGTLIDGTVFDSSVERGEPITFPVGGVIRGWVEALQKMKVGDKWQLYIPSSLAYGPRGAGGAIGPHETLIFEVELLGIEQPDTLPEK